MNNRAIIFCLGMVLTCPVYSQVSSRIKTRLGIEDQLKDYGRVSYMGIDYYTTGKDSLLVKNWGHPSDSVVIPPILTIDKKPYQVTGFKDNAFEYDVKLRYISLPSSITETSSSCFYGCSRLQECDMSHLEVIGAYSFFRTAFTNLTFSDGLRIIDSYAFTECHSLKYVELPASLKYISDCAFLGCSALDTVKVHFTTPIEIGSNVFWLYRANAPRDRKVLMVPAGSKPAFEADDRWRLFQEIIEFELGNVD